MSIYISLMRLTTKGLNNLDGSAKRRELSERRVASLGGCSKAFFATLGIYDFVQVFDMPSNEAMMEYVLKARQDGYVDPIVLPAFDVESYGNIVKTIHSKEEL